jgi:soluble lytic murein transglycosylase-like protein
MRFAASITAMRQGAVPSLPLGCRWAGLSLRSAWVSSWLAAGVAGLMALSAQPAFAGAQVEEPLADSVRSAMSAAIGNGAAPSLVFADATQRQQCESWALTLEDKLLKRKPEELVRREFLHTVCYEAKRAGLDPSLVLGLIQVESGFRKYAISSVGARGYMQVMPFWSRTIGNGDVSTLFHMQTNIRFGCVILRHYLDREKGNLFMALGRYNGSRGRAEYPNMVTAARRTWQLPDNTLTRVADAGLQRSSGR